MDDKSDSGIIWDGILSGNQTNGWIGNPPMAENWKIMAETLTIHPCIPCSSIAVRPSHWILLSLGEDTRSCPLPGPCHSTARILRSTALGCWTEEYSLALLAIDTMSSQGTVSRSPTKAAPSLKSRAPIAPLAPAETWLPEVGCIQLKSDWWQRQDLITIHDIHMCVDKAANRSCSWMNDFHG